MTRNVTLTVKIIIEWCIVWAGILHLVVLNLEKIHVAYPMQLRPYRLFYLVFPNKKQATLLYCGPKSTKIGYLLNSMILITKNPRRKAHAYMCVYVSSFFEGLLRMGKGEWDGALTHPVTYNDAFKIQTVNTSPWSKLLITHTSK